MTRTTVGVVLVDNAGRVLMQRRDDIPTIADPGCWVNPGGEIDADETPEDGVQPLTCFEGQELRLLDPATLPRLKTSPDLAAIILNLLSRVSPPAHDADTA